MSDYIQSPGEYATGCVRGDTWSSSFAFSDNNVAMDLTGYTFTAAIDLGDGQTLAMTVTTGSLAGGIVGVRLESDDSTALVPGIYSWYLRSIDTGGDVRTWIADSFSILEVD
jgi:hypothetical protein